MAKTGEVEWFDYSLKADAPNAQFVVKKRSDGNDSQFAGYGAGVSADVTSVKIEDQITDNVKVGFKGPSLGATAAAKVGTENCVAAIVEPSLCKAEGQYKVTENGSLCGSVGVNATTGLKINEEGAKAAFLGFGLTLGVGGKWTIDTPFGSGGYSTETLTNTHKRRQAEPMTN